MKRRWGMRTVSVVFLVSARLRVAPELCPGVGGPVCFFCFCVFFRFSGGFVELGPCVASHFGCDGYVDCCAVVVCGGIG